MRKRAVILFFVFVLFAFPAMVFANAGPTYTHQFPSLEMMTIDHNSQIIVENEKLVFNFEDSDRFDETLTGKVTATYEMVNPTDEPQSIQMLFPFVGSLYDFNTADLLITSDEVELPFDIYLGESVSSPSYPSSEKTDLYDFERIVSTITNETYNGKFVKENGKGKLYVIDVKPSTNDGVNLVVELIFNSEKTKIVTKGFSGYENYNEQIKVSSWSNEPTELEIFVIGEDIDFNVNGYLDGEKKQETDLFSYETSANEVEVRDYLLEFIKTANHFNYDHTVPDTQLYNLFAKSLDRYFLTKKALVNEGELLMPGYYKRIFSLAYTVDFPANSSREVAVSYRTFGTMDKTETEEPLYSFDYLFNPAENWSDFQNISIKIIAPNHAPFLVKSSIKMEKEADDLYVVHLAKLPTEDLSFTLHANEEIKIVNRYFAVKESSYLTPLIVLVAIVLIAIGIVVRARKK
jgi:hypothetical protein